MSTEELALVVTGIVGALGVLSPVAVRWVDRGHERDLARGARLHQQRLAVYVRLGRFLENERWRLEHVSLRVIPKEEEAKEEPPTRDEWTTVQGEVRVAGSTAVATALDRYYEASFSFNGERLGVPEHRPRAPSGAPPGCAPA